jgi:hypothetical protein
MTARRLLALAAPWLSLIAAVLMFYIAFRRVSLDDMDGPNWWAVSAALAAVLVAIDRLWKR